MTDQQDNDELGRALNYRAQLPLSWEVDTAKLPGATDINNEKYLHTILALSEHHLGEHTEEIAVLEQKVDIALDMLAVLLRATVAVPDAVEACLGARELLWKSTVALPQQHAEVRVSLYLHDLCPRPLVLTGKITKSGGGECCMAINPQPEEVQQLLEKYIFLQHRRAVAQRKITSH